jgi:hypothetical protein
LHFLLNHREGEKFIASTQKSNMETTIDRHKKRIVQPIRLADLPFDVVAVHGTFEMAF